MEMLQYGLPKMVIPCMFFLLTQDQQSHKCSGLKTNNYWLHARKTSVLKYGHSQEYGMMKKKSNKKISLVSQVLKFKNLK